MKQISYALCVLFVLSSLAFAAEPDYSGDWELEQVNGIAHGEPFLIKSPEADSGIVITHTRDSLVINSNCDRCGSMVKEYILDSKTREMPNDKGALVSYSARWDGDMIVIKQGFGGSSPFGPVVVLTRKSYKLSPDGQILTVFSSNKDPDGEVTMTQIYRRMR